MRRAANPKGDPAAEYKTSWDNVVDRAAPYNGVANNNNGVMQIQGVVGAAEANNPPVLYIVGYSVNGEHPQALMKSRLETLTRSVRVLEH